MGIERLDDPTIFRTSHDARHRACHKECQHVHQPRTFHSSAAFGPQQFRRYMEYYIECQENDCILNTPMVYMEPSDTWI